MEYSGVKPVSGNHHVIFFTHFKDMINTALNGLNVDQAEAANSTVITHENFDLYSAQWDAIKNQIYIDCD